MILYLHYDRLIRRWNSWNSCAIFLNDQDVFVVKVQPFRFYYALSTSDHITIKPCKGCLNQAGGEKASRHLKHWKHALLSFWRLRRVSYMNNFSVAATLERWLALCLQNSTLSPLLNHLSKPIYSGLYTPDSVLVHFDLVQLLYFHACIFV